MSVFPSFLLRLLAVVAICAGALRADPDYTMDVWTPYEGLPQSRVLGIAQTPDGYLWVSTQLGWLARFDGLKFTRYTAENAPMLVSPEIQMLEVDERGVLWIGDVDGRLTRYAEGKFTGVVTGKPGYERRLVRWLGGEQFVTAVGNLLRVEGAEVVVENAGNPNLPNPLAIEQYCQDAAGTLWCHTYGGRLGRWQDGQFQPEADAIFPSQGKVTFLLPAADGGVWIGTNEGLWKEEKGVIARAAPELAGDDRQIVQMAGNRDGSMWLRTESGALLVRDGVVVQRTPMPEGNRMRNLEMRTDSQGCLWIFKHNNGIWHVDAAGTLSVFSSANGLPSDMVDAWFEDREKNIWLGTAGGLVRLRRRWFQNVASKADYPGGGVSSICEGLDGDIWLGRVSGLTRIRDGVGTDVPLPEVRKGTRMGDLTVAPGDEPGEIWMGTVRSGTGVMGDGEMEFPFPFPAAGDAIRVIRRDAVGGVWFGGEFGLFRWDGKKLRKFGEADGLTPGHIFDISFDAKGIPWIAKADDLLVVYRDGKFQPVALPGISPNQRLHTVLCGKDGTVWLGTVGSGLLQLAGGKWTRFTTADGLPGDSVTQLLEDDDGFLWGGTQQGLFRASAAELVRHGKNRSVPVIFRKYGHSDGLPNAECSGGLQPACWKARDGRLWFSTSDCAVVVNPRQLGQNLVPPSVIIEKMELNGTEIPLAAHGHSIQIIPAGLHRFVFDFTGINFTGPEKIAFQWRLQGLDNEWVDGSNLRTAAYSGLAPGLYQFAVRARNNDGVWSTSAASIDFRVEPFWWQRPLVRIGFILAGLILVATLVSEIMRRKHLREMRHLEYERSLEQQRFRHRQAMTNERSRIAAELHDDLGANLTQIQWLTEAVQRDPEPASRENHLLHRVSHKTHEMVRLIDQIVWAVNPKNDTLDQLVTYVCNFAEDFFRDSPTRCRIDVADEIPARALAADVRHNLFLVAKEALHNVAKHAATDRVWVRVTFRDDVFQLVVEDRGRGFDPATAEAGDGLANMRRRAGTTGAALEIDSSLGGGTRVTLRLSTVPETP